MRRAEEVHRQSCAAKTEYCEMTEHTSDLSSHPKRRVYTNQVEHQFGALTSRHVFDTFYRVIAREKNLVGPHVLCAFRLFYCCIHSDDHRRRAQGCQYLDGHLPKAARADHYRG